MASERKSQEELEAKQIGTRDFPRKMCAGEDKSAYPFQVARASGSRSRSYSLFMQRLHSHQSGSTASFPKINNYKCSLKSARRCLALMENFAFRFSSSFSTALKI